MKIFRSLTIVAMLLGLTALPQRAEAIAITDVTLNGTNASFAYGPLADIIANPGGNISVGEVNTLLGGGFIDDQASSGGATATFGGFQWEVTAGAGPSGNWDLTLVGPVDDLPIYVDLFIVLKASNDAAGYLFDNFTFSTLGPHEGTYTITFENNGGQFPGLSHLSAFFRSGAPPDTDPCLPGGELYPCEPGGHGDDPVPEPASLLLLGTGLAGVAAKARKRFRKQ